MASNSAIWQVQDGAANGTEAVAGDSFTVDFNESPINADGGLIVGSEFNIRRSVAENPRVTGDGNEIQDMGLDGIDIQITGIIKDADGTNAEVDKLMTWQRQSQIATGYTRGRFGIRLDDFPAFNMVPTSTYGAIIQSIRFIRDPEKINKVNFILTLRVGGDFTGWFQSNNF